MGVSYAIDVLGEDYLTLGATAKVISGTTYFPSLEVSDLSDGDDARG